MNRVFLHKILAVFLSFLMAFSAVSFSVDVHYCGEDVKSYSFFGKAKPCQHNGISENNSAHSCCSSKKEEVENDHKSGLSISHSGNCCHNESHSMDIPDTFENDVFENNGIHDNHLMPENNCQTPLAVFKSRRGTFLTYHPPPLDLELLVLYQVFRI